MKASDVPLRNFHRQQVLHGRHNRGHCKNRSNSGDGGKQLSSRARAPLARVGERRRVAGLANAAVCRDFGEGTRRRQRAAQTWSEPSSLPQTGVVPNARTKLADKTGPYSVITHISELSCVTAEDSLTWSLVACGTEAVRARLSPRAGVCVVARQDDFAVFGCAPLAAVNGQCFQGDASSLRGSVLRRRLAGRRDVAPRDGTAETFVPVGAVRAHRLKALCGSSLLTETKAEEDKRTRSKESKSCEHRE